MVVKSHLRVMLDMDTEALGRHDSGIVSCLRGQQRPEL